jgi:aminoglycoside phosphotransferase (APT) family kinase protein
MPYAVSYSKEGFVTARVWGEASKEDHFLARDESARLCREKRCSRLLVDLRDLSTTHLTTTEFLQFGQLLAKAATSIRLAHVVPKDPRSRADVRFTSTVEANRGVETSEFETIDAAKEWLLRKAPPPAEPRSA